MLEMMKSVISFKSFFNDELNYKSFFEKTQNESLNSHADIIKIESENDFNFYYFVIEDKSFRVILEKIDDETGINFEQFLNGKYVTTGVSNNLSAKEVLTLFGTVFYIINKYSLTKHYSIFTDDKKKFRLYLKILSSKGALNVRYNFIYNGKVVHIEFETTKTDSWIYKKIKKFKYKIRE